MYCKSGVVNSNTRYLVIKIQYLSLNNVIKSIKAAKGSRLCYFPYTRAIDSFIPVPMRFTLISKLVKLRLSTTFVLNSINIFFHITLLYSSNNFVRTTFTT